MDLRARAVFVSAALLTTLLLALWHSRTRMASSTDEPWTCAYFRVAGTVQGVFFRKHAREAALAAPGDVRGWVRNTRVSSGERLVEALVCTQADADLTHMRAFFKRGSPQARVTRVDEYAVPLQDDERRAIARGGFFQSATSSSLAYRQFPLEQP